MTRAAGEPLAANALIGSSRVEYPGTRRAPMRAADANATGPDSDQSTARIRNER
jgi:hypothetical protein